jgi:hypothetical protein
LLQESLDMFLDLLEYYAEVMLFSPIRILQVNRDYHILQTNNTLQKKKKKEFLLSHYMNISTYQS